MLELSSGRRHFDREGDVSEANYPGRLQIQELPVVLCDSGAEEITGIIIMDRRPDLPDMAENSKTHHWPFIDQH